MILSPKRQAAFKHVDSLVQGNDYVDIPTIRRGFYYDGLCIPLVNPQKGIHKPRVMSHVLSISTLIPRSVGLLRYDDQLTMLRDIREGRKHLYYSFMGTDPDAFENRALRRAFNKEIPLIYFLGIRPGQVLPIIPAFIVGWERETLEARIEFGSRIRLDNCEEASPIGCRKPNRAEYAHRLFEVRTSVLQRTFRDEVFAAYNGRCTLCGLPEPRLLDAAHIVPRIENVLSTVTNGLLLCENHRAAFDCNLIGVDPEYRLYSHHLDTKGHRTLEVLKSLHGKQLELPKATEDRPNPQWLRERFKRFKSMRSIGGEG